MPSSAHSDLGITPKLSEGFAASPIWWVWPALPNRKAPL